MNRSTIDPMDSDSSNPDPARAATAANDATASSGDDSDVDYVYIDAVDDPADDDDTTEGPSDATESRAETPLRKHTDELINRYLRRTIQAATPQSVSSRRASRSSLAARANVPPSSCSASQSSDVSCQATIGTTPPTSATRKSVHDQAAAQLSDGPVTPTASSARAAGPLRRSVRLKSITDDCKTPSRKNSLTHASTDEVTIDEVSASSTSGSDARKRPASTKTAADSHSSASGSGSTTAAAVSGVVANELLQRRLQTRLQRMSVDMANLSVSSSSISVAAATVNNSTPRRRERRLSSHSDSTTASTAMGPSPRKQRARTPSVKCLESFNIEDLHLSTPRRTGRTRTPSKRYAAGASTTPTKQRDGSAMRPADVQMLSVDEDDEDDDDANNASGGMDRIGKSTMLFDRDADVAGQQMFAFRTPKKRNAMAQLAAQAPQTPQTPKTPKHRKAAAALTQEPPKTPKHRKVLALAEKSPRTPKTPRNATAAKALATKTPSRVRSVLKRELAKFSRADSSDSDFSADESDEYKPNESDSNDDDDDKEGEERSSSSSESSSQSPELTGKKRYAPPAIPKTPSTRSSQRQTRGRRQQDFVPECEGYFTHHTSKKTVTSDRTLDRMKTPRLPHDDLFKLLATTTLSAVHEKAVTEMHTEYRQHFSKWLFVLNEGYSILLHGLGSKRNLLQQFHQDVLADQTVLVVNGFFPSLTIKDVLDSIAVDILELNALSRNPHEILDAITEELAANGDQHIFLIVHNIDGVMLRNHKAQLILSRLAKVSQIHLIASMDHINAPLLWDHIKLSNFNFSWWDCTTLLPYTEETAFENSMLVNNSGGLALSSMKNVFLSLTQNSRGIFLIIVRNQLNNKGNSAFQGMSFKELYSRCREDFLVSSDVALRSQLTEFIDHQLVKMRRTADGIENLLIPLDGALLEQFLELQENND